MYLCDVDRIVIAEIVEFCRFLEPTAEEAAMREAATQRVRQSITEVYASASVQVFGSFVTGQLCILQDAHSMLRSFTSDMSLTFHWQRCCL
jgi:DNA polymerase sigma